MYDQSQNSEHNHNNYRSRVNFTYCYLIFYVTNKLNKLFLIKLT